MNRRNGRLETYPTVAHISYLSRLSLTFGYFIPTMVNHKCHNYGLFHWVPLHMAARGAVLRKGNEYEIHSVMTAGLMTQLGEKDDDDGETAQAAKMLLEQYLSIQKFYYGDYYPLTQYS